MFTGRGLPLDAGSECCPFPSMFAMWLEVCWALLRLVLRVSVTVHVGRYTVITITDEESKVWEDEYSTQGYPAGKWWGRTWGQFFWAQPFIHLTLKFGDWSLISFCIPCRDSFFLNLSFLIYSCHPIVAEFWVVFVRLFRVCVLFQELMYFTWFKIVLNMMSKYFLNRISPLKDCCIPFPSPEKTNRTNWRPLSRNFSTVSNNMAI